MEMSPRVRRWKRAFQASVIIGLAMFLSVSALVLTNLKGASAAESADLTFAREMLRNCQLQLALPNLTSGERTAANRCVSAQTKLINSLTAPSPSPTGSPSPSTSPSASPSVSPSSSPSPSLSPSPSPSVSPSPTPTPTPTGPIRNCFGDVKNSSGPIDQVRLASCGYPTLESTGVQDGIVLTRSSGTLNITVAGTVLANREHTGCIYVHTTNVVIRNVRLFMGDSCFYGISTYNVPSSGPTVIENSEVICSYAHGSAVAGPNFRAARLYLSGCENGAEINANSSMVDSYIVASEKGNSNAHGDGIQSQGGSDVVIRHNTFAGLNPITASIISNPDQNSRWTVTDNFFSAGAYTVYCPENVAGGWIVTNNRFYGPFGGYTSDPHRPAYGFTDACGGVGTWLNNFRDDTLADVGR